MKAIPGFPPLGRTHENMVPQYIKDDIGYNGWAVLSWALHHGWVQEYKKRFSQEEGRDVGVPGTIERMMTPMRMVLEEDTAVLEYLAKGAGTNPEMFQTFMAGGYLLGTNHVSPMEVPYPDGRVIANGRVPDEHGPEQLTGELRRSWVKARRLPPSVTGTIPVDRIILGHYFTENKRHGLEFYQTEFTQKLGL